MEGVKGLVRSETTSGFRNWDFRLLEIFAFKNSLVPVSRVMVGLIQVLPLIFPVFIFQTGEKLFELHGHAHKITAIAPFFSSDASEENSHLILTASADRAVIVSLDLERFWIYFILFCSLFSLEAFTGATCCLNLLADNIQYV